jgi:hypothetical protein
MSQILSLADGLLLRTEQPLALDPLSPAFLIARTSDVCARLPVWTTAHAGLIALGSRWATVGAWQQVRWECGDLTCMAPLTWLCDVCADAPATRVGQGHHDLILCAACATEEPGIPQAHHPTHTGPLRALPVWR